MAEKIYKIGNKILKIGGNLLTVSAGGPTPPPTPVLPDYTIRLKYEEGFTPTFSKGTGVQVSSSPNIWDLTYQNSDWSQLLISHTSLLEVIDANSTGVSTVSNMFNNCTSLTSVPLFDTSSVTNMAAMFNRCSSLTSVPLFDISSVTNMADMFANCYSLTSVPLFNTSSATSMYDMFGNCSSLTSVPLFDTSSVTNMNYMFYNCPKVESGALALYQQASTQATVPSHSRAFRNCGRDTVTGAAELAQIPSGWK